MKEHKVVAFQRPDGVEDPLTELLRRGAHDLISRAVETEMAVFMTQFAGVQDGDGRHRTQRTKGCVTRQTMLALVFKLGMCAQKSFRRLRGFESLAKVITGVKFKDGIEVIQPHHRSKTEVSRVAA